MTASWNKRLNWLKQPLDTLIHGPSLAIGAAIASVFIVIAFVVLDDTSSQTQLQMEPAPAVGQTDPVRITAGRLLANGSPLLGDTDAPITLIEFGDYQCHFCNVFFESTESSIIKNYVETGKVKMIFKDYNIIGPDSVNASHGAHCAGEQGLFWEYHDILYTNWDGENTGWASSENLMSFAKSVDLDMDAWSQCMTDQSHSKTILASNEDAQSLKLSGTPAFFVMGADGKTTQLFGAQPYETFEKIFEQELKK